MRRSLIPLIIILLFISPAIHSQNQITLEAIFKDYMFFPKTVQGIRSLQDGENYTVLNQFFYIDKYSYAKGDFIQTLFSVKDIENSPFNFFDDYEFSSDETKILLTTEKESQYRHSYKANYYIYDLLTKRLIPLEDNNKQQIATFSPDGRMVAFMRENNLFIKDLQSRAEHQITTDGEWNKIINGAPDWVYEEEFGYNKAFDWSPDSKKLLTVNSMRAGLSNLI